VPLRAASVRHWQAPLAVNQSSERTLAVRLRPGALTTWPVRLTVQDARTSFSRYGFDSRTGCLRRSGGIGRHAKLRPSCPKRRGSSTLPFVTDAGLACAWLAVMRPVRPARYRGLQLDRGWASAQPGPISLDRRVRHPDPPLEHDRVRKLAKRPGREPGDFVGSTPTSVTDNMIPWSNGKDAWMTPRRVMVRFHPGSLRNEMVCRCFGCIPPW
jgi:hypothetical protein